MPILSKTDSINLHGARSRTRSCLPVLGVWAFVSVLVLSPADPAAAGHGTVSYENQLKAEQREKRERQEQAQPAPPVKAVPAVNAPAVATPAGAVPVVTADGNRAFVATVRQQLTETVRSAEGQIANGTDPQLAKLAKEIAEESRERIAELDKWLAAHPDAK